MSIVEAMTEAMKSVVDAFPEPDGVVVIIGGEEPSQCPDNGSLKVWQRALAARDAGKQPFVIWSQPNIRVRQGSSEVHKGIRQLTIDPDGLVRTTTRGIDNDGPVLGESVFQAIQRGGSGLKLPIAGVIVIFPPSKNPEISAALPQQLREFFGRDIPVVADYTDVQRDYEDRYAAKGIGETVKNGLEVAVPQLGGYNRVTVRNPASAKQIKAVWNRHQAVTGSSRQFSSHFALLDSNGEAKISISPTPKASQVRHGMAPELRAAQAEELLDDLGLDAAEHEMIESLYFETPAFGHDMGRELSQSDYGLAN